MAIQWCPSHCDIQGNNTADLIAKDAAFLGLLNTEYRSYLRKTRRLKWEIKRRDIIYNNEHSLNGYVQYFKGNPPNKSSISDNRKDANLLFR